MKTYYLKVIQKNGETHIESESDGFNGFEILAFLNWKSDDIMKQLSGEFKPDIAKRTYVQDEE